MRPYLAKGLPELEVPPVEPLVIEELAMENNAGAVRIKALFTNITAKGPSNFTVRDVRSDISVSEKQENRLLLVLCVGVTALMTIVVVPI